MKLEKSGAMCKLGIEKADYLIDWELLVDAMRKTDFMEKWVNWIDYWISFASFVDLVNGSLIEIFSPAIRGL